MLGRSRNGFGIGAATPVGNHGRAVAPLLAPGRAHEAPLAPTLLGKLAGSPLWVAADKGYASEMGRALMWGIGAWPAIPAKRGEAAVRWPAWVHKRCNKVERLRGGLEQ